MRIVIVGGGPAGLYLAILCKKQNPAHEVTVFERNPAGQTFGWGVVFSDETMAYLQESDAASYDAITRTFAHWDAIDTHVDGRVLRSGGHGFSGIARRALLQILQARCRTLGVDVRYDTEIDDIEALARTADLFVGADGVKSKVRGAFASVFEPSLELGKSRYIWLGTHRRFEAFTFFFERNAHGTFQVHAYRFDADTSTFIVECDEASWRAAGLDKASTAESVAYCEALFARHLDGHPLLDNKSAWLQFVTVRNKTWHHENVVLLGDAAHTAHFSIGSGTKIALEDSIALAKALHEHPTSVPDALAAYEEARRPVVERIQWAAQSSLQWFENAPRYALLEPEQLVFSMMTRSKKVTYDNLRKRDPQYIADVTRWFATRAGVPTDQPAPPPMFTPFTVRKLTLPNRVVVSPMCMYAAVDGLPNEFHRVHYGSRATGGAGLVMTEMTNVAPDARITPGCAGIWSSEHAAAWKTIVDYVHARTAAKIGVQLGHAGRKGSTRVMSEGMDQPLSEGNWPLIAASALPYHPHSQVPRAMDRDDMDRVRGQYVRATELAIEAGFDLLELHAAHGYLLATFLSPLTNVRTDAYGGSLENRLRFPLEIFDVVRAKWPADRPMSVRISAFDWQDGGLDVTDAVFIAQAFKRHGADLIDVSSGQTTPDAKPVFGRMYQTPFSDQIRHEAGVATIAVGAISSADQVNTILASGRADLCALARPHLADPYWTMHAAMEQGYDLRPWPTPYLAVRPPLK